ncbi:fimbrial protein [Pseudomonas aeruginosa]|uniref:fimbrial protein n=1 Tax=Pseudomonas aeruginosa TaxID=287 RepID=UPI0015F10199|nr:fimbrial protein [Pseudomonas aeruginosa]MBA4995486.1 type 1 fimbrial protein [Pseudomonas aeruginosa]MBG7460357.1 type 1 fimbrial protein [Pseudomonas aeruginosa]HBP0513074.1 type 1 fimbrial protein [Pseudomonas aeruginosa]HBP0514284.1 type 1 fimbrial protein [Pseudomonas aeruginosa]HCL3642254.1 type 1 fimbrial protein [Pseudomonas aeruginosa]
MNMFKRSVLAPLAVSGALMAVASPSAFAADGVINFMGSISDTTCDINGQAPGEGNVTQVDLGTVSPAHFTAVNIASDFKPFDLVLSGTGCTNDKKVSITFDGTTNVDQNTGNLKLTGNSQAGGVQIQIFNNGNGSSTKIPLGGWEATPQQAEIKNNTTTLKYKASYISTADTVTAGSGVSHIRYVLAYQ